MKRLIVLVSAIVGFSISSQAQLLLSSGQSYSFEFSTLQLFAEDLTGFDPRGYNFATFYSNVPGSTPGAMFTVDLFENNLGEAPIGTASGSGFVTAEAFGGWLDLQGIARVTVDSGAVLFDSVLVTVYRPTPGLPSLFEYYSSGLVPVPEPGTLSLGALGLLTLLGWNFRKGRR